MDVGICAINNTLNAWYNDTNNCYSKTNLASDLAGKPNNKTYPCIYILSFNLSLDNGWNLVSVPLKLKNETLPEPLNPIKGKYSKILTYLSGKWIELKDGSKINETLGLWININKSTNLSINGTISNLSYSLNSGWNMIGYLNLTSGPINKTFNISNIDSIWMYNQSTWYSYDPEKPASMNTLKEMNSGYGYWVNVKGGFSRGGGSS